ncbi:hypothetical protein [Nocardia alni]|uniref:hypothetical protein n=1 Tax=Nocardia alni TaxID=2815723 RepID=UPI001C216682|nr:hypothetical protein [Nocardia alni]
MSDSEVPSLTSRTTALLAEAADTLAERVRATMTHSPRPVFLYYIAQTFDILRDNLSPGHDPRPRTPAQQLCLHLMIEHAERAGGSLDADLIRAHRTLLPDRDHEPLLALGRASRKPELPYDFVALSDALTPHGTNEIFDPFEPDDMVA